MTLFQAIEKSSKEELEEKKRITRNQKYLDLDRAEPEGNAAG
jgi:hypothetical protein